jgi:hypothetical protein
MGVSKNHSDAYNNTTMGTQLVPGHPCDFQKREKSMDAFMVGAPGVWLRKEIHTYMRKQRAKEVGASAINNVWIKPKPHMSDTNGGIRRNRFPMSISTLNQREEDTHAVRNKPCAGDLYQSTLRRSHVKYKKARTQRRKHTNRCTPFRVFTTHTPTYVAWGR